MKQIIALQDQNIRDLEWYWYTYDAVKILFQNGQMNKRDLEQLICYYYDARQQHQSHVFNELHNTYIDFFGHKYYFILN